MQLLASFQRIRNWRMVNANDIIRNHDEDTVRKRPRTIMHTKLTAN